MGDPEDQGREGSGRQVRPRVLQGLQREAEGLRGEADEGHGGQEEDGVEASGGDQSGEMKPENKNWLVSRIKILRKMVKKDELSGDRGATGRDIRISRTQRVHRLALCCLRFGPVAQSV